MSNYSTNDPKSISGELITDLQDQVINSCLSALKPIVNSPGFEKHREALRKAEERYNDPELKIAVIGDFNTGKSTFINAMLKKDALSTDMVPTTVIPTYIRWNSNRLTPSFQVCLFESDKEYSLSNIADRNELVKKLGFFVSDSVKSVEKIVINNDLIDKVRYVTMSFPKDERFQNLCLIDTPGVNPGGERFIEHANITRSVLKEDADSTIILFPAESAGHGSFLEYINDNLAHLVRHSSFVITKFDLIEGERDEKKMVPYLKGLLHQRFGIEDATVYTCSAKRALNFYTGKSQDPRHAELFDETVSQMMSRIDENRKRLVCNKLISIIKPLIMEINEEQIRITEQLTERLELLEKYSSERLQEEYDAISERYTDNLIVTTEKQKKNINNRVSSVNSIWLNSIKTKLGKINGVSGIKSFINNLPKNELPDYERRISEQINRDIKHLKNGFDSYSAEIAECLNRYSLNINKLDAKRKGSGSVSGLVKTAGIPNIKIVSTAGILAGLLLLFNPAVLLGAVPFLLVGGILFYDTLIEKARKILYSKIESNINSAKPDVVLKWKNALDNSAEEYKKSARTLMDDYKAAYNAVFREKEEEYNKEKAEIDRQLEAIAVNRYTLSRIEKALEFALSAEGSDDIADDPFSDETPGGDLSAVYGITDHREESDDPAACVMSEAQTSYYPEDQDSQTDSEEYDFNYYVTNECICCGTCVEYCPNDCIDSDEKQAFIDPYKCSRCGICKEICPVEAIKIYS